MTPERFRQVNALADAAIQMTPGSRATFLDGACGSDIQLRREVQALVDAESHSVDFLEKPLLEVLAGDLPAPAAERNLAGSRIQNYEVISRLGAGGIGEVWLARDLNLDREVAVKLLSPRYAGSTYHTRRFQQEARSASALNHPNIVTIYEIGQNDGALFIAQERVSGETIRELLSDGPLPLPLTIEIATQAAAALGAAHAAGIVHRDIKPENVMRRADGLVKVLDFGLARFVERQDGEPGAPQNSLSIPGLVLGTVRYMSPEQARGLPVDSRSDIFSLGVMLYEMAAGTPPFSGSTPTDTLAAILTADPAPLSRHALGLPPEFESIVRRCLAKEPGNRYATAGQLKDDLMRLASPFVNPRSRRLLPLVAAGALAAGLAGLYLLIHRTQPTAPFEAIRMERLQTRNEPSVAAISSSGKLLAYLSAGRTGSTLWIRNLENSEERALISSAPGEYGSLVFSPDESFIYYRKRGGEGGGDLYRVPVRGGPVERVAPAVSGTATLSPDGKKLAFVRLEPSRWEASLVVSNADGSGESTILTLRRPRFLDIYIAWSPDGRAIACFTGQGSRFSEAAYKLVEIRVADHSQREISSQSWIWPRSLSWSPKGGFLVVTAAAHGDHVYQLWKVRYKGGAVSRLTNDLSNYDLVSLTGDGESLATVQSETSAALWVADQGDAARAVRISSTPLRSTRISVTWMPDGRVLYSDPTGDYRNLWVMEANGAGLRRLSSGDENEDQIAISRQGRYIVYKQSGNIWRMDADGSHPTQLTHGPLDVHPDITPDGRSVVYASFSDWSPTVGGEPTLWKVPINGGDPVEITRQPASYPRVSPDGSLLGCIYFPGKDPRFSSAHVGLLRLDGTGSFTVLDGSPSDETEFSWSPDGKALDYISNSEGAGNLWRQPIAGGPPRRITNFAADEMYGFAWSRTGRLVCARGATTHSVIRIDHLR